MPLAQRRIYLYREEADAAASEELQPVRFPGIAVEWVRSLRGERVGDVLTDPSSALFF